MRKSKANRIMCEIKVLNEELHKHQEKCKHMRIIKTANSNIGERCRNDDLYWWDCYCPTCLKRWIEPQQSGINNVIN